MREVYAYTKNQRSCGKLGNMTKLFAGDFTTCIYEADLASNQATPKQMVEMIFNCLSEFKQIFNDYRCMKKVRENYFLHRNELCDCKLPCYEMEYDFRIGSSQWPAPGSQANTANQQLAQSTSGPLGLWLRKAMFSNASTINGDDLSSSDATGDDQSYVSGDGGDDLASSGDQSGSGNERSSSDSSSSPQSSCGAKSDSKQIAKSVNDYVGLEKANDVMKNFIRVTVYVKSRTVEQIQEVASYTLIDLISDIGNNNNII